MANILQLACPIDGTLVDVSFLQEWSDYMAIWTAGMTNRFAADSTVECSLGHRWAVNFQVEFTRSA